MPHIYRCLVFDYTKREAINIIALSRFKSIYFMLKILGKDAPTKFSANLAQSNFAWYNYIRGLSVLLTEDLFNILIRCGRMEI